ncbi:MAG: DUF4190 domain-containing protein [Anaerolineales bacterium]|nr:DUF4190 domain-containing protein [Anaerolineales bacterium]MCS7247351.1 DUF4190 domain-containing protein [Anaerolineales bacterium]MDW8161162.1 DUF4190 domain-containing protein [Anaerolineales bacterium]MDW8446434.1 DUF4190 domain-containing protein [Anaerolineales bacterium]
MNSSSYPPSYSPPTSSMAVVSLVAGILGLSLFPFIGSIVAVITGNMAKGEIRNSRGALGGEGLAKAGVILGWIGIGLGVLGICGAIIAFLIPLLLVALGLAAGDSSWLPLVIMALS